MKQRDLLELIMLGAIWGASFLFMKLASHEFGPIALIEVRVIVAGLFLSIFLSWKKGWDLVYRKPISVVMAGALNSAVPFCLFAFATLRLPAGYSSVLNATVPFFGALIGWIWLRESMSLGRWLGLAMGFLGVVILVSQKLNQAADLYAVAAGLTASSLYGIGAFYTKHQFKGEDPMATATTSLLASSILLIPLAIFMWPQETPSSQSIMATIALGVLCTGVPYAFYFRLLQRIGATQVMTVTYLVPMFGVLWGAIFLRENITLTMLAGGAIILFGVWVLVRPKPAVVN